MFIDACAIVSLMTGEDTAPAYERALARTDMAFTSAMSAWEAIIVLSRPDQLDCRYSQAETVVTEWLEARGIDLREAPDARDILANAVAVAEKHGIGRSALSNFDCFHYAHAKTAGAVLLTMDQMLQNTDVPTAP